MGRREGTLPRRLEGQTLSTPGPSLGRGWWSVDKRRSLAILKKRARVQKRTDPRGARPLADPTAPVTQGKRVLSVRAACLYCLLLNRSVRWVHHLSTFLNGSDAFCAVLAQRRASLGACVPRVPSAPFKIDTGRFGTHA